jgi:hypothetical protein
MRHASKLGLSGHRLNVVSMRPRRTAPPVSDDLNAFRGILFATSASLMLWSLILTGLWLAIWKK